MVYLPTFSWFVEYERKQKPYIDPMGMVYINSLNPMVSLGTKPWESWWKKPFAILEIPKTRRRYLDKLLCEASDFWSINSSTWELSEKKLINWWIIHLLCCVFDLGFRFTNGSVSFKVLTVTCGADHVQNLHFGLFVHPEHLGKTQTIFDKCWHTFHDWKMNI